MITITIQLKQEDDEILMIDILPKTENSTPEEEFIGARLITAIKNEMERSLPSGEPCELN
jgi:hypothetical protein